MRKERTMEERAMKRDREKEKHSNWK